MKCFGHSFLSKWGEYVLSVTAFSQEVSDKWLNSDLFSVLPLCIFLDKHGCNEHRELRGILRELALLRFKLLIWILCLIYSSYFLICI